MTELKIVALMLTEATSNNTTSRTSCRMHFLELRGSRSGLPLPLAPPVGRILGDNACGTCEHSEKFQASIFTAKRVREVRGRGQRENSGLGPNWSGRRG